MVAERDRLRYRIAPLLALEGVMEHRAVRWVMRPAAARVGRHAAEARAMRQRLRRLLGARAGAPAPALDEARAIARLERDGPAPLAGATGAPTARSTLAVVVPYFRRGSGGHTTIANLVRGAGAPGPSLLDLDRGPRRGAPGGADAFSATSSAPSRRRCTTSLDAFAGADVVVATGWQTVAPVLLLEGCGARAYLVQDHEPEFYPASAERQWADASYRHGLHCITAGRGWPRSPRATARRRRPSTSASTTTSTGRWASSARRRACCSTRAPRRRGARCRSASWRWPSSSAAGPRSRWRSSATRSRRPRPSPSSTSASSTARTLARAYAQATVGMVLSLTNHSLVAQEMLACGLAAVELDTPSTRAAFGPSPPVELAPAEPLALADALARLLDDAPLRERRRVAGEDYCAPRTWAAAAEQVEAGLRAAISAAAPAAS